MGTLRDRCVQEGATVPHGICTPHDLPFPVGLKCQLMRCWAGCTKCFLVPQRQGWPQSQLATGLLPVIYMQWQVGVGCQAEPGLACLSRPPPRLAGLPAAAQGLWSCWEACPERTGLAVLAPFGRIKSTQVWPVHSLDLLMQLKVLLG